MLGKTGGDCEKCGQWFETQRYEDQGYGFCDKCIRERVTIGISDVGSLETLLPDIFDTKPMTNHNRSGEG